MGDNIKLVAAELAEALRSGGHVCLHAEDWGKMKTTLEKLEEDVRGLRDDVRGLRETVAGYKAERNFVVGIVGFIGSVIGGVVALVFNR